MINDGRMNVNMHRKVHREWCERNCCAWGDMSYDKEGKWKEVRCRRNTNATMYVWNNNARQDMKRHIQRYNERKWSIIMTKVHKEKLRWNGM